MEEAEEILPILLNTGGMEVDTPYYAKKISAITFNAKINKM